MKKVHFLGLAAVVLAAGLAAASAYMLRFSLYNDGDRSTPKLHGYESALRDTFIVMPSGERQHAIYMRNDSAHGRTAIVLHGYKDKCWSSPYLGQMYRDSLGFNVLLPDLHGHGLSDGDDIQMGWKDRTDVRLWAEVAEEMFRDSTEESRMVIHGVSMGAATVMCLSGEDDLPPYVSCFVEDCGYTSVWDEFRLQLKEMFGLPSFPLMHATSLMCRWKYGWSFQEASALEQVARCKLPMLFIHGDADTFVPYSMLQPLYEAKPQPKAVWVAAGSGHARAYHDHPEEYTRTVRDFTGKYMSRR